MPTWSLFAGSVTYIMIMDLYDMIITLLITLLITHYDYHDDTSLVVVDPLLSKVLRPHQREVFNNYCMYP